VVYKTLTEIQAMRDTRLVKPLWNFLIGDIGGVRIPDGNIIGYRWIPLKPPARDLLAKFEHKVAARAERNLTSTNPRARQEAAELISRFSKPSAYFLTPLRVLIEDDHLEVRLSAIAALGNLGRSSIQTLLARLSFLTSEPAGKELEAVTQALARRYSKEDARKMLSQLMPYLDADKYPSMVIYHVLRTVEKLGYSCESGQEDSWDLVLPALARLKSQAEKKKTVMLYLAESLATYIPERVAARRKAANQPPP
jgi:hypothetical protein